MPTPALEAFLAEPRPTPFLVLDAGLVARRYAELAAAFPGAEILYAVKACPEPDVLRTLAALGSGFDVAGAEEIALCLAAGADPARLCHGNPVRGPGAAVAAAEQGVRRFVTDSVEDLTTLPAGVEVLVRVLVADDGAATPFLGKFGATAAEAARLARGRAGIAFHAGSQQLRPTAFAEGVRVALRVASAAGIGGPVLDVGGGLPVRYRAEVPPLAAYADAIHEAVAAAITVGDVDAVRLALEPGRALVAEAGVLRTTALRVSRRPGIDHRRWVYLDAGRYQGLAEAEGEAIDYPVRAPGRSGPPGPVVLAGPTCDGDDVLYRRRPYALPLDLAAGDAVDLLHAGAYTASYASVGFNGFGPLPVHVLAPSLT
ncbi:type III PLP-dependent enzyme [Pseudonocardia sp. RS11V-5]|uniref:type III PLP-dependent enzyme n=1 Tax=Pseudonocardia terrae TaxID=2905831 RepID=UPI001E3204E2|nr:type III PLP-dependent enzyme [Pseudonocardia terrae]MCE3550077.1 type III PLP-dependent enzyme [Pseudonocardia terrae]